MVALSSAEAELYAMVAASAETLAIIAYARDLGIDMQGEIHADSSAALGIAQRAGIGKVRHLRTQGLWVQEARATGRLKYFKVLGTKNPSDVLTKFVPAELMGKHMETLGVERREGRAEAAPELNCMDVCSLAEWMEHLEVEDDDKKKRRVTYSNKVMFRAIPYQNKGRKCKRFKSKYL